MNEPESPNISELRRTEHVLANALAQVMYEQQISRDEAAQMKAMLEKLVRAVLGEDEAGHPGVVARVKAIEEVLTKQNLLSKLEGLETDVAGLKLEHEALKKKIWTWGGIGVGIGLAWEVLKEIEK